MTSRSRQVEREIRRRRKEQQASLERNRKRLEQELRVNRERLADLNRQDVDLARWILRFTLISLAIVIGLAIWIWAAEMQAQEVEAAVLRSHRITDGSMYALGPGVMPGQNQNCPILVPELPETPPEDGAPPEAIEPRTATEAEAIPEDEWVSLGEFRLTFYCPCYQCSEGWGHQTASGAYATEGRTIAVDPRVIPYGTEVRIGDHVYVAEDCGGSIDGNEIDVFKEDHGACLDAGVQYSEIYIKKPKEGEK